MDNPSAAREIIRCLDLTSLGETDTAEDIKNLCLRSVTPVGSVAAVCIYPKFIPLALRQITDNIRIATVVNFPSGTFSPEQTGQEIGKALRSGADEIDAVFPYHAFLDGDFASCRTYLEFIRRQCGAEHPLKIILETGELRSAANIKAAARLTIDAGADFIKTSTGKTAVSATPEAANAILEAIKASGKDVGFKASGGIKTTEEAKKYLVLAASIMGPRWISPQHFRIGASSLLDDLLDTIKKGY